MSENDIKKQIISNLKKHGIRSERMNRGSFRKHGVWLKFGFDGMPDILAFPFEDGRVLWVETKDADNTLSEDQREFRAFCIRRNIPHVTAKSWEDVEGYLIAQGVIDGPGNP